MGRMEKPIKIHSFIGKYSANTIYRQLNQQFTDCNLFFWFRFGVNSGLNLIQFMNQLKYDGAAHADDICYIFQ